MLLFLIYYLWPPYAPAQVNGGSRNFYTWWTLSVNRVVTRAYLDFFLVLLKLDIFSDPARKLSALTPERGRIL